MMQCKEIKKQKDILDSFLSIKKNKEILELYQKTNNQKYKVMLNEEFEIYYSKIIVVSYYSKTMYFFAQKYDMETKKQSKIIDKLTLRYCPDEDNTGHDFEISSSEIRDYITNEKLYKIISRLPKKQQQLLFLIYIKQIEEDKIADYYGITRQAINKMKNKTLSNIKENFSTKEIS